MASDLLSYALGTKIICRFFLIMGNHADLIQRQRPSGLFRKYADKRLLSLI